MSKPASGKGAPVTGYLPKDMHEWYLANVVNPSEYLQRKVRADMGADPVEIQENIERLEFDVAQEKARLIFAREHHTTRRVEEEGAADRIIAELGAGLGSRQGKKAVNWLEGPGNSEKLAALEMTAEEFLHLHVVK